MAKGSSLKNHSDFRHVYDTKSQNLGVGWIHHKTVVVSHRLNESLVENIWFNTSIWLNIWLNEPVVKQLSWYLYDILFFQHVRINDTTNKTENNQQNEA